MIGQHFFQRLESLREKFLVLIICVCIADKDFPINKQMVRYIHVILCYNIQMYVLRVCSFYKSFPLYML